MSEPTDVLLATTVHWASTTRLALAFAEAGLRVALLAPAEHALHGLSAVSSRHAWVPHRCFVSAIAKITAALRPAIIVPGDDRAVRGLHALYDRVERGGPARQDIAETIRRSLGDPSSFAIVDQKSRFAAFCRDEGLPLPKTATVQNRRGYLQLLRAEGLPQVLKLDGKWSGLGVRIVRTESEASVAFDELAAARGWGSAARFSVKELSLAPLVNKLRGRAPAMSLQRYVAGRLANRAMYCRDGDVLAGITVATMRAREETDSTTVARVLDHPEIATLAARVVRRLKLSGFIGIDVVLEEGTGRPWLLELNPRPTQTCHFALSHDTDMVGALATELRGTTRRAVPQAASPAGRIIALYPGEFWRDPASEFLREPYHDIPLHEPKFIAAYSRPVRDEPSSWVQSLARTRPLRALRQRFATVEATDAIEISALDVPSCETAGRPWQQLCQRRKGFLAMTDSTDVAIIGAGPYGLSLSTHLAVRGVEHAVIGAPMAGWSKAMPRGMSLKSEGFASNLFDPDGVATLERFCAEHETPYADLGQPVALDTFIAYGLDFQRRHVPHVEHDMVISLEHTGSGFRLRLASGGTLTCRRVVAAVGVIPFRHVPDVLAGLPDELLSHSSAHHELDRFRGRDVTVIGGGASAIDLAALLHECGASVRLIARHPKLPVHEKGRLPRPLSDRIRNPMSGIGPSWRSLFYTKAPFAFYHLPEERRLRVVRNHLGPAGGWFMAERIAQVPTILGCSVRAATRYGGRARLLLAKADGSTRSIDTDHVIAATGYRPDIARLDFLGDALRRRIPTVGGAPLLSRHFETKVPGLFMIGPVAANCFGPVMRFAVGAGFTARWLARLLAGRRAGAADSVARVRELVEIGQKASPT